MRIFIPVIIIITTLLSCKNQSSPKAGEPETAVTERPSFFPVTAYLKGQLYEIKSKGVNPLKYTTIKDHTDSAWLKIEDLDATVKDFLSPVIDSLNLVSLFTEKKFLDQTINAFTFTYDPSGKLPDTMQLKHWDVYIDPETGKVRRIYMVKETGDHKMLQLTWQGDKWCRIATINTEGDGSAAIEKEEKITWDF